jgi:hypothetical protein
VGLEFDPKNPAMVESIGYGSFFICTSRRCKSGGGYQEEEGLQECIDMSIYLSNAICIHTCRVVLPGDLLKL